MTESECGANKMTNITRDFDFHYHIKDSILLTEPITDCKGEPGIKPMTDPDAFDIIIRILKALCVCGL